MSSINQYLSDLDSAAEAADKLSVRHALSTSKQEELKQTLLSDSYWFTYIICRHRDMVPEIHMPMSYMACGLSSKLKWCLTQSGFESYPVIELRRQLKLKSIDITTDDCLPALDKQLQFVNFTISRGTFKSSVITHGGVTFTATRDPNSTSKITSAKDDKAWQFCEQIGETMRTGLFRDLFPERFPVGNPNENITSKRITFGGRTISHPQTTVNAGGYLARDISAHYDHLWTDDLLIEENATTAYIPIVHRWLTNRTGLYMVTKAVREVFVGTRWDDENGNMNDVYWYLTTGRNAINCLSLFIPIEEHDGEVTNILERGRPTMPSFIDLAKIQEIQDKVLSDDKEVNGIRSWRNNYLLNPQAGGNTLFTEKLVNDPDRQWRQVNIPLKMLSKGNEHHFLVQRYARDEQSRPIDKNGKVLVQYVLNDKKQKIETDWRSKVKVITLNPFTQMDIVMTVDFAWKEGGNNWAVTAAAVDHEGVKFQLETQSGTNGMEGWIEALCEMEPTYTPRVIGFGAGGYQDPMFQNMLKIDPRLRRLRNRFLPLPEQQGSKKSRIKAGVLEPLKMYRLLLVPRQSGGADDYGAQITRDEMIDYKGDPKAIDGILDSLWMIDAVAKRRSSPEEEEEDERVRREREQRFNRSIDPVLGVPMYAA